MAVSLPGGVIWVCTDCALTHHGYSEEELGYKPDLEPWALWGEDCDVTAGGNCLCWTNNEDCDGECDRIEFSWAPCDGCGSTLGGSRDAFTYWTMQEVSNA